ncbi:MAG: hypothetical protein ACC700_19550 [Anaerolineales bacterium]
MAGKAVRGMLLGLLKAVVAGWSAMDCGAYLADFVAPSRPGSEVHRISYESVDVGPNTEGKIDATNNDYVPLPDDYGDGEMDREVHPLWRGALRGQGRQTVLWGKCPEPRHATTGGKELNLCGLVACC